MLYKAIQTALKMHDRQFRKLDGDIYAAHPLEVGMILAGAGASNEVVIAGILHDTVEDTAMTLTEIEKQFGAKVAHLVKGASEADKSLTWKDRKTDMLHYVKDHANADEQLIILADKLSNIKSIFRYITAHKRSDPWEKFNAGYHDQKWYYTEMLKALAPMAKEPKAAPLYSELQKYVDLVFSK